MMVIFGTSLLAICFVVGMYLGDLLGVALGVKANVGGVGLAMILLIFAKMWLESKKLMPKATEAGVGYWGAMYIPIVVAMAAQQNVVVALKGGWVALIAAVVAFALCACCIALLSRTGKRGEPLPPLDPAILADAPGIR
jgi:malonate transporter MadL subunit